MILSARKSYNNNTLFTRLELNLTSLLQNGRVSTVNKGATIQIEKTRKSSGNSFFDELNIFVNLSRNFWLFSSPFYRKYEYCRSKKGSFRTFLFFKKY